MMPFMFTNFRYILLGATLGLTVAAGSGCRHLPEPSLPEPAPLLMAAPALTNATPAATNLSVAGIALPIPEPATNAPAAAPVSPRASTNAPHGTHSPTNMLTAVEGDDDAYEQIRLLTKTLMVIRSSYVDETKTSYKDLVHAALGGMVQSLDPYSQFMEPPNYRTLKEETQGEFGGIGIVLGIKDGTLSVISPMEDTPAFRAGILAGDKIIEINDEKTDGMAMPDAIKRLRGDKGSDVRVKVLRNNHDVKEFPLKRDFIKISSVKGTRVVSGNIGYVRLTQFTETTAANLQEAMEKLAKQDIHGLILDLRNNPGGLLKSAIQVSQMFLKEGKTIVSTRGREGKPAAPTAFANDAHPYDDLPMAILVNAGSASAAEIVAGALQDNKRAILVGDTTYGKGSVQSVMPIEGGNALRLTTARYYTPSGRSIHEKGIEPDIVVPLNPEEWGDVVAKRNYDENPELFVDRDKPARYATTTDRQMERAIDLLKGIMIFEARR